MNTVCHLHQPVMETELVSKMSDANATFTQSVAMFTQLFAQEDSTANVLLQDYSVS